LRGLDRLLLFPPMSLASPQDVARIRKGIGTVLRQGARLQALFALALPCVCGLLLLYGVYDSIRMHQYHNAAVVFAIAMAFFCPVVLVVFSELDQRGFARWLETNVDALVAGEAAYRGARISMRSEVVTFELTFSVVVASFKVPSQMFVVGQHRIWPWRIAYTAATLVLGWWGIPWGPIYTVQSLHANFTNRHRRPLYAVLDLPGWEAAGGNFGAILPKS
jgi:hypothetical protein